MGQVKLICMKKIQVTKDNLVKVVHKGKAYSKMSHKNINFKVNGLNQNH